MSSEQWIDYALLLPHLVGMFFAFAFGACAGSFINVVAWRLPQGISIVSPPSRCPVCGYRLPWYDNMPVLGYLRLRGRCSACGVRIPPHYVLIEIVLGLVFVAVYGLLFMPGPESFWFSVGKGWWVSQGPVCAAPALVVVLYCVGSLAAMLLSDARTFHIPLLIPTLCSLLALAGWVLQALVAKHTTHPWPVPLLPWPGVVAALGGALGLCISIALLRLGVLKHSFADYDAYVKDGEIFAEYPHARREMGKELAFCLPPVLLAAAGFLLARNVWTDPAATAVPLWVQALAASCAGLLAAGALVWAIRIGATLLLGVEAMGLGDVHLMAAVGATFGWKVGLVGFLLAPFVGLAWWVANLMRHAPLRMPFGPSLAVGSVLAFAGKPVLWAAYRGVSTGLNQAADAAREDPMVVLAGSALCAVVAVVAAAKAGRSERHAGGWAAAAILAMLVAVLGWVFGSPAGVWQLASIGAVVAVAAGVGAFLARADTEEDAGPRTALARILRLLAVVVVLLGVFLAVARPAQKTKRDGAGPLQPIPTEVQ
ncbi:MAG: prepilin peptidase [Phycisphaerales bacterium]